ncbi:Hermansky-Pudlak syndrome 5 protein homolog [Pollicipes pollicipes]|uniref:Hermansky-Pudlak syndrome 5 protein homolog n=1 Tax=Pollicipes pollicipes TaxID=41117 RepID=UPI001884FABC|nr:Hermansky-Pudlak syndrome 5 protein homolog [Pollicipes pollicipes]
MPFATMEPYLAFEDVSLEGLAQPLKGRTRIQYTCFTVSHQFIMIGTNTGGVYVFNRTSRQFVSILPGQWGPVTCLAVDGAEQLVAAGSQQGAVSVYACPTARSWSGQLAALARLDAEVRALCWRHAHWSGRLVYVGTAAGKVLSIGVGKKKTPAASATITPMLQLDSAVCDMVLHGHTLLVSTLSFCYLCNIQIEVFAQVGTQPRAGRLGACFLGEVVFCARPGLRLWEVELSGRIVSTHQLRPALDEAAPRRVVSACDEPAALGFVKLVPLLAGGTAAFSGDAVFVVDMAERRVLLWTNVHRKVRDLAAVGDELYVQCEGGALRRLRPLPPSQIVREMRLARGAADCARFLVSHGDVTDLCRSRRALDVVQEALPAFADDAEMRAELARLAAVLRDRLSEDAEEAVAADESSVDSVPDSGSEGFRTAPSSEESAPPTDEAIVFRSSRTPRRHDGNASTDDGADPGEVRGVSCAPAAGSPAWLAEVAARRFFYLLEPDAHADQLTAVDALYVCRHAARGGRAAAAFAEYLSRRR